MPWDKHWIGRAEIPNADPEIVGRLLEFLDAWLSATRVDLVILFGCRANAALDVGRTLGGTHKFMIVVRDDVPDDVLTGQPSWTEMTVNLGRNGMPGVDLLVCRRTSWDNDVNEHAEARQGILFVERQLWLDA